jgi:predicted nucleic acid-binding Zn ribbon protein
MEYDEMTPEEQRKVLEKNKRDIRHGQIIMFCICLVVFVVGLWLVMTDDSGTMVLESSNVRIRKICEELK